jgi:hypothetical protein
VLICSLIDLVSFASCNLIWFSSKLYAFFTFKILKVTWDVHVTCILLIVVRRHFFYPVNFLCPLSKQSISV